MKLVSKFSRWIVYTCLGLWTVALLSLVSPSTIGSNDVVFAILVFSLMLAVITSIPAIFVLMTGISARDPKKENYSNGALAKSIAGLLVAGLLISTIAAIKAISTAVFEVNSNRFVLENISVAGLFISVLLVFLLSAIQKDVYWISRDKAQKLDERQVKERQQVFEKSYKIGAFLVLGTVWFSRVSDEELKHIMSLNATNLPGHIFVPLLNMAIALFALPLILAAWKKS